MTSFEYSDLLPADHTAATLRADVLAGLRATPKWLPPKWFYDKVGSALFEEITRLPEYYPTRSERAILQAFSTEIVQGSEADTLVELGSGSSEKTRLLLDALPAEGASYVALDVSETALRQAGAAVSVAYPGLRVSAVRADFEQQLTPVLRDAPGRRRLVAFLGGTIGNLAPAPRTAFLTALRAGLRAGDSFLLGADLVKSPDILVPAYDDAAGVTAAFNRNVLDVLNQGLAGDLEPADFAHRAVWDAENAWIEMRLRARRPVTAHLSALDLTVTFEDGEELRTEISAKFTRARLETELRSHGFRPAGWWTDPDGFFSLSLWGL